MKRRCRALFELILLMSSIVTVYLCTEDEFYSPYVRIQTKSGETFISMYSNGFLDLSTVFGAVICLNGPAVLHTGMQRIKSNSIQVYDEGFLNVYSHRCHSFNEISTESRKKKAKEGGKNGKIKRIILNDNTNRKPLVLNDNIEIRGIKIYGVTLIGKASDYRQPEIFQFNHPNLGHNMNDKRIVGVSFVVIGSLSCWCTILPIRHSNDEIHKIIICPDGTSNSQVCDVLADRQYKFNELFTDEFIRNASYVWRECESKTTPSKPNLHVFEPFSFNVPELHNGNPKGQSNQKPTAKHLWELTATNCIDFPRYTPESKC